LIVGVAISAPVGPVNVLCIQRAVQRGVIGGVAAGLGAVFGDGLIALAATMGIGAIDSMVTYYRGAIQFIGGLVLLAFGVMLARSTAPVAEAAGVVEVPSLGGYMSDGLKSFLMTITNPGAVLGLFAIFGGIGTFVEVRSSIDALVLVAAIMAGSLFWWTMLSVIVARIKGRLGEINTSRLNLVAGIALIAFGVVLLAEIAWQYSGRHGL